MKTKNSKAQTEVWETKELLYEKVKHLPLHEQINTFIKIAAPTVEELKKYRAQNRRTD